MTANETGLPSAAAKRSMSAALLGERESASPDAAFFGDHDKARAKNGRGLPNRGEIGGPAHVPSLPGTDDQAALYFRAWFIARA